MSQAIETDETIEIDEEETEVTDESLELDSEDTEEETGEVEIVLEGEDEPTSEPAVKGVRRLVNRVNAAKAETSAARDDASDERRKREAVEEENKLLRIKLEQQITDAEPNEDDFESTAEYQSALKDFYKREATRAATEETQRILSESQQETTKAVTSQERSKEIDAHYERVASSEIPGYDELEGKVIDTMGQEFVEEIAANTEKSHIVIAHLGVNLGKAEKFAQMAKVQPVKTLLEIGALAERLKVKRKQSTVASPETQIDKGSAVESKGYLAGATFE